MNLQREETHTENKHTMKTDDDFDILLRNIEASPCWEEESDALKEVSDTLWSLLTNEQKTAAIEKLAPVLAATLDWTEDEEAEETK